MVQRRAILQLPEGDFEAVVDEFHDQDIKALDHIYKSWRTLCNELNAIGARSVNLPDGLSEIAFSIAKGVWRCNNGIIGANSSFDCYDPKCKRGMNRIQVKACSVLPDLTSFGPKSQWDKIFFVDFYRMGNWDGTFDVYEINTKDVNNFKVNARQSVQDQKNEGRRPRFSIYYGLIQTGKYISKETYQITDKGIVEL